MWDRPGERGQASGLGVGGEARLQCYIVVQAGPDGECVSEHRLEGGRDSTSWTSMGCKFKGEGTNKWAEEGVWLVCSRHTWGPHG